MFKIYQVNIGSYYKKKIFTVERKLPLVKLVFLINLLKSFCSSLKIKSFLWLNQCFNLLKCFFSSSLENNFFFYEDNLFNQCVNQFKHWFSQWQLFIFRKKNIFSCLNTDLTFREFNQCQLVFFKKEEKLYIPVKTLL